MTTMTTAITRKPLGRRVRKDVTLKLGAMIALPVSIYSAVGDDTDSALKVACTGGGTHPISKTRSRMTCLHCQAESAFVKARETSEGLIEIDPATLAAIAESDAADHDDIVLSVHPAAEVSASMQPSGKSYYLGIEGTAGARLYALLAQVIADHPEVALMARFTMRSAASPFRLVVSGQNTIVLQQQASPELVREMPVIEAVPARDAELAAAGALIEALIEPFDPQAMLRAKPKLLAAYTEGKVAVAQDGTPAVSAAAAGLSDLTAAFQAAIDAANEARGVTKPAPRRRAAKKSVPAAKAS